jgi:two-component system response regulator HydG
LLVNTFINRLEIRTGKSIRGLTREALNRFMDYRWPGNVREMKSALEYAFTVADKDTIDIDHLPPHLVSPISPACIGIPERTVNPSIPTARRTTSSSSTALQSTGG